MVKAIRPGGTVLDLQVIRPNPCVEVADRFFCAVDGEPLFRRADAATAAIEALIRQGQLIQGQLIERGVDDHDVCKHYSSGADLVDDFEDKERQLPAEAIPKAARDHAALPRTRALPPPAYRRAANRRPANYSSMTCTRRRRSAGDGNADHVRSHALTAPRSPKRTGSVPRATLQRRRGRPGSRNGRPARSRTVVTATSTEPWRRRRARRAGRSAVFRPASCSRSRTSPGSSTWSRGF